MTAKDFLIIIALAVVGALAAAVVLRLLGFEGGSAIGGGVGGVAGALAGIRAAKRSR